MTRSHRTERTVHAGCLACGGHRPLWTGANAQAVAARHHDASGHTTWVEVLTRLVYGERGAEAPEAEQVDLWP